MGIALYSLGYMLRDIQYDMKIFGVAFAAYIAIMLIEPSHIDLRTNTLNEKGCYILALRFQSVDVLRLIISSSTYRICHFSLI